MSHARNMAHRRALTREQAARLEGALGAWTSTSGIGGSAELSASPRLVAQFKALTFEEQAAALGTHRKKQPPRTRSREPEPRGSPAASQEARALVEDLASGSPLRRYGAKAALEWMGSPYGGNTTIGQNLLPDDSHRVRDTAPGSAPLAQVLERLGLGRHTQALDRLGLKMSTDLLNASPSLLMDKGGLSASGCQKLYSAVLVGATNDSGDRRKQHSSGASAAGADGASVTGTEEQQEEEEEEDEREGNWNWIDSPARSELPLAAALAFAGDAPFGDVSDVKSRSSSVSSFRVATSRRGRSEDSVKPRAERQQQRVDELESVVNSSVLSGASDATDAWRQEVAAVLVQLEQVEN